jgi:lambda family phage tail tape measure protein
MGMLNKNTKSLAGNMGFLTNAFRGWLGFLGVREIVRMSDEMQNLNNRLKLTSGGIEGAKIALESLAGVADRTNQSVDGVGQIYNRLALSLQGSGASTKELISLTETLVNSFRVAGTTTGETVNTIIQLSQAFSSGQLRGQELRSVMEQNASLAGLLKQRFGQDIYKKAEAGAISVTEVLRVLADNQKKINDGARELAPTFEQTLTKAMNKVSLGIGQLNKDYEISAKFAVIVGAATNNMAEILIALGGVITVLAYTRIPAMITAVSALSASMWAFARKNPMLLGLTALATAAALVYENWDKLSGKFNTVRATMLDFAASIEETFFTLNNKLASILGTTMRPEAVRETVTHISELRKEAKELRAIMDKPAAEKDPLAEMQKNLESLINKIPKANGKVASLKEELAELNQLFLKGENNGGIGIDEYYKRLIAFDIGKVKRQFAEGKNDVFKFHEALRDLEIAELNRQFARGALSLEKFNKAASSERLKVLNEQVRTGKIALSEYHAEVIKLEDKFRPGSAFYSGAHDFVQSVGTLSQGVARVTSQAFDHLSDTLTDFIKKGKADFASFAKAVLDDITAMIVRAAIVRPIAMGVMDFIGIGAEAFSGGIGGGGGGASPGYFNGSYSDVSNFGKFANGGIMTSGGPLPLNKYANGGIANSPQLALFGEGRRPEAYVPLPDGRNIPVKMDGGGGGIVITQNIVINSDGTATSDEKTTGENAKQLGDMMKRVALDTIIQQRRPGGVLA